MTPVASTKSGERLDVVVIGGGQAALATAYFLRRTGLRFVLPKAQRAFDAIRNDRIRTDFSTGKSVRALAAEHHLVERQVARIVADIAY